MPLSANVFVDPTGVSQGLSTTDEAIATWGGVQDLYQFFAGNAE